MIQNPVEYIQTLDIIKKSKLALAKLTGLDFEILNLSQAPSNICCSPSQAEHCNKIPARLLREVASTKKPALFSCPSGMKKMISPLILKAELVGVFFVGENKTSKLDQPRLDALAMFLSEISNYILENELSLLQNFKGNPITHKRELLQKVIKYLWNNVHKNQLSLKEVARDNGVSYSYLSHLFKNELETTFVEYRTTVKMLAAAKLLQDCRLTVDQISGSCGFEDSSYFCKSFRKTYGCSPGAFRRQFIIGKPAGRINDLIQKSAMKNGHRAPSMDMSEALFAQSY